ncbi:MAG: hypothetical protein H6559_07370 [Lewinellaceae bacterium]|nr:hypothetical protein [Lewinellaceae bacterium]
MWQKKRRMPIPPEPHRTTGYVPYVIKSLCPPEKLVCGKKNTRNPATLFPPFPILRLVVGCPLFVAGLATNNGQLTTGNTLKTCINGRSALFPFHRFPGAFSFLPPVRRGAGGGQCLD